MRIVQVTPRYPPRVGGVEAHVEALATELAARGHSVTVVSTDRRHGERSREFADGVEIHRLWSLAPDEALHLAPGVVPVVRSLAEQADVVHVHNYHSLPLSLAAFATEKTPLVATPHYHGTGSTSVTDRLLRLYRPVGRRALARADARICVSEWERDRLREDFGLDATVIPNGLDTARFDAVRASGASNSTDRDRPYLLSVGRLATYKGIDHLIRSLPELPEFDLVIAGDGEERRSLEQLARDVGVDDRVEFLGFVDADDLPGLYANAAATVTLSTVEAYGLTVAESLASGTPCVVRSAGALTEWASRDDCVAVPGRAVTPESVAGAVRRAVDRSAPGEPLPDWSDVTDRVLDVYESVRH